MGRYERIICYLYEYQDGHKGANVGYVKLEKRGEQCRVLIQMRSSNLATLPQAALFQQEKTGVLLIPIGTMRDNNGSMQGRYEGSVDNLADTGISLNDVHGVLVYAEEGHYFASTWNLEQIDARQIRWWQDDEQAAREVVTAPKQNAVGDDRAVAPKQNATADDRAVTVNEKNAAGDDRTIAVGKRTIAIDKQSSAPDGAMDIDNRLIAMSESGSATTQSAATSASRKTAEQARDAQKAANNMSERYSQSAGVKGQSICGSCPFQRKELDYGKRMLLTFPVMRPFGERYPGQCVRIEPQDIGCLPMRMWSLSGNPFLMQGYFQYRHLIFMEWEKGYAIGVPGIYSDMMQSKAENAGFCEFIAICGQKNCRGAFGYWLTPLD